MSSNLPVGANAALSTPIAAEQVLQKIMGAVRDWQETVAVEATKQHAIAAEEARWLAAIEADREILLTYLDRSFDERRENFRRLFEELDRAMSGDTAHVADVLAAITTLAMKSPFQDLKDVDTVTANLSDPNYGW
jgi:hypothetical protein